MLSLKFLSQARKADQESDYPDTSRIEAFSDGVFAVAITFLVFNIKLPEPTGGQRLSELLLAQWPAYASYVVSFTTIGIFWANHHYMFRHIKRSDHILCMINVLFLMCIAFLPFPTALLANHIRDPREQRLVVLVYAGVFAISALTFSAVWLYASHRYRLVERQLDRMFLRGITTKYFSAVLSYVAAFVIAFWNVTISLIIVIGLALLFLLPSPHVSRSSIAEGDARD